MRATVQIGYVDSEPGQIVAQALTVQIGADRADHAYPVAGPGQGQRGVGGAPADSLALPARLVMGAGANRRRQVHDFVPGNGTDNQYVRHGVRKNQLENKRCHQRRRFFGTTWSAGRSNGWIRVNSQPGSGGLSL